VAKRGGAALDPGRLTPRQKVWLVYRGSFLMGPQYLRFLEAVEETGTIREAGRAVGWSYRTCLNRVRRMERVLGAPVLLTSRGGAEGGGARLSPAAARLVAVFRRWQRDVTDYSRSAFARALPRGADRRR
jgi:molybdate transport system regulatory protein